MISISAGIWSIKIPLGMAVGAIRSWLEQASVASNKRISNKMIRFMHILGEYGIPSIPFTNLPYLNDGFNIPPRCDKR
jgi:hypothetical protein